MKRLVLLAVPLLLASCTAYQQQAGAVGGIAGALAGAAFGDDHQDVIAGAAVGAALGAGGAAVHEESTRRRDYARYGITPPQDRGAPAPSPAPRQAPSRETAEPDYPVAERSENPDQVFSPYPPHHRIDVSGFRSGQLARDPKTNEIFRVP